MTTAYEGDSEVEDNDFFFRFKRLILRESEVAIEGDGRDEDGPFKFEGALKPITDGPFYGPITITYPTWAPERPEQGETAWTGTAYLSITKLGSSRGEKARDIKGAWVQDGEKWDFSCELSEIQTRQ